MRRRVPLSLILTRGVRFTRRRRTRANMNTPMRLAMVALSIAALAVVANAANVTGDAVLTFSDLSFDDVLQQLVKAESLVPPPWTNSHRQRLRRRRLCHRCPWARSHPH